jgi:GNAT superfamily N-acetyltransferase
MEPKLRVGRAQCTPEHQNAIIGLIDEAREWLPAKGTAQWSTPWPDRAARDARVWRGLELGATWVVWEDVGGVSVLAATVTVTGKPNKKVWSAADFDLGVRAVYAHRLITARRYKGWDLGGELLDWTGLRGRRNYGARSIRIDVWTSNEALHGYYMKRGFERCGRCPDRQYPSGVLLQKPTREIPYPMNLQFAEAAEAPAAFSAAGPEAPPYEPRVLMAAGATRRIPETPIDLLPEKVQEPCYA